MGIAAGLGPGEAVLLLAWGEGKEQWWLTIRTRGKGKKQCKRRNIMARRTVSCSARSKIRLPVLSKKKKSPPRPRGLAYYFSRSRKGPLADTERAPCATPMFSGVRDCHEQCTVVIFYL